MAEQTNVNIDPSGYPEVQILEGKAPAPIRTISPKDFSIKGAITTPRQYAEHHQPDPADLLVTYSEKGEIQLQLNHREDLSQVIKGVIQEADDVNRLQLTERFSLQGLAEHLKINKDLCAEHEEVAKIVTQLKSFRGTVTQVLSQEDKQDGNRYLQLEQKFQHDIPQYFIVELAPYKGAPIVAFTVEILMDVRDGQVSLWLQSYAYQQAHNAAKREVVKREIEKIEGMGYLCLQT